MILAYLPDPHEHPLWNEIERLLERATTVGVPVLDSNELVWIAFEGTTLFGVATTILLDGEAQILACSGFEHRRWIEQADALVTRWARDCGALKITMRGRLGWKRYLTERLGWGLLGVENGVGSYEKALASDIERE